MDFYSDGNYNPLLELSHYFYFEFNIYIVLLFILVLNCIRAFLSCKKPTSMLSPSDLFISIGCEIAFANALMFQGVIADISLQVSEQLFNKVFALCILSFVAFILQIYFTVRYYKRLEKI